MAPIGIEWMKTYVISPALNDTTIKVIRFIPGHYAAVIAYIASEPEPAVKTHFLNNPSEGLLMNELRSWISNKFGEGYSLVEIQS